MYVRRPPKSMAVWPATDRPQGAPTLRRVDPQPPPQGGRDARADRHRYPGWATLGRSIERLAGGPAADRAPAPAWDLPLRIVVATGLVVSLTGIAPTIGAHLTGLLSPFPVYAGVLAIFAHRQGGGEAANNVLKGLLLGLFSFGAFFLVLSVGLSRLGTGLTFLLATVSALAIQGLTLKAVRSGGDRRSPRDLSSRS